MGSRSTNYEVYHIKEGRWHLHANYAGERRDEAIEEAKSLEKESHIEGTCVVKESYDSRTNEGSESVIYHSPSLKTKPNVSAISGGGAGGGKVKNAPPGSAAANAAKDAAKKEKKFQEKQRDEIAAQQKNEPALRAVPNGEEVPCLPEMPQYQEVPEGVDVVRLAISFLAASIAATIVTAIVFAVLQLLGAGGFLGKNVAMALLAATFGLTFLAFFVPSLKKVIANSANSRRVQKQAAIPDISMDLANREYADVYQPPKPGNGSDTAAGATDSKDASGQATDPSVAGTSSAPAAAGSTSGAATGGGASDTPDEGVSEKAADGDGKEKSAPKSPFDDVDVIKSVDDFGELPEAYANKDDGPPTGPAPLNRELKRIVTEAQGLWGQTVLNDAYVRFGMILFLAGFAEPMSFCFRVSKEEGMEVLVDNVQKLGIDNSQARGFCLNVDEYLLDDRYFGMYAAGRRAANWRMNDDNCDSGLKDAMKVWRAPPPPADQKPDASVVPSDKAAAEAPDNKFVAVLFTDIVDSTSKQQSMGDEWLMKVVRAHNEIVREALKHHKGREIKHMGDGIMASFPAVSDSVESALAMQMGFERFRQAMPDLAFGVRAGISAGEPIHEDGDLFGTPVNLAARVLNKAADSEVAVSAIVREMCRGKGFNFEEMGSFELKGFDEPQPIFRVSLAHRG